MEKQILSTGHRILSKNDGVTKAYVDAQDQEIKDQLLFESENRSEADANLQEQINDKQDKLTAGNNITIVNNVISATGIEEAPDDGKQYARKNKMWSEVETRVSSWEDIQDKPDEFPPSTHTHTVGDITNFPAIPSKTSDLTNDGEKGGDGTPFVTKFSQFEDITSFLSFNSLVNTNTVVINVNRDLGLMTISGEYKLKNPRSSSDIPYFQIGSFDWSSVRLIPKNMLGIALAYKYQAGSVKAESYVGNFYILADGRVMTFLDGVNANMGLSNIQIFDFVESII